MDLLSDWIGCENPIYRHRREEVNAFDECIETDLKAYLDSYGVPVRQGSKLEDLKAENRK